MSALLTPDPWILVGAVAIDLVAGDPEYAWHPIRLIGRLLSWLEDRLRAIGLDGYAGGILLFVLLSTIAIGACAAVLLAAAALAPIALIILQLFLVYSLLALGDLIHHVQGIESAVAAGNLDLARQRVGGLVGRDTDRMD